MSVGHGEITVRLRIVVERDGDEFHAYCPALKGLHTFGRTEEEAVQNARDGAIAYLLSLIKHGDPIPVGNTTLEHAQGPLRWCRSQPSQHIEELVLAQA